MQLSFGFLAILLPVALTLWLWREALRLRDVANAAAMEACARLGLQFLDGTVAFSRWRWTRENGGWQLRRTFIFDYTANSIERRQGFVLLFGNTVEAVGFATEESATATDIETKPEPNRRHLPGDLLNAPSLSLPSTSVPDKVLDLTEWRARRERRRFH